MRKATIAWSNSIMGDPMRRISALTVAATIAFGVLASFSVPVRAQVTAFEGARLIVGDGRAPIENAIFVVNGARIVQAGPAASVNVPAGAMRVNLAGKKVEIVKIWVDDRNGMYPKLTPALYGAIIDEAHKNGLRVTAHIFMLDDAKGLLRANVDAFAHSVRDRDVDDEFMTLVRQHP